ncbi:AGAP004312-PC-like protein [Anopheles sinensis]|uniref:AGAP004312-PC-like protein n=1 Tax=Anopheles sinensis TaxID=74873 RepID=A0A084W792_ANOSI|nr:AGAP004312-PC-like protein [Anopheles sinensis]
MIKGGFAPIQTSGCLDIGAETDRKNTRRSQLSELRNVAEYEAPPGSKNIYRVFRDHQDDSVRSFDTQCSSIGPNGWEMDQTDGLEGPVMSGWYDKGQLFGVGGKHPAQRGPERAPVQLMVARLVPISIRPKTKTPQVVNVCQTFRFPDNFITQTNANRLVQHQEQTFNEQQNGSVPTREDRQQHLSSQYGFSGLGGFYGMNRNRQRSMHSQTSRTLLELVEAEQSIQQQQQQKPPVLPRTVFVPPRKVQDILLATSGSESTISCLRPDRKGTFTQGRDHPRARNAHPLHIPYFNKTKVVDGGATMDGHYGRSSKHVGNGKQPKHGKVDQQKQKYEDSLESPFVSDPHAPISGRNRRQHHIEKQSLDGDGDSVVNSASSQLDELEDQEMERLDFEEQELDELEGGSEEEEALENIHDDRRNGRARGGRVTGGKDVGISAIVDKLQDNVWEVCLEGIWDLMDISSRIDWKAQEKYITVINRKLIEFLKSPRTALCRSACQVSGELFREAKSTKRPEFDEIVDILLCKTADPNRFIQKDANVALEKLVTHIPIPHTVRALSIRGTIHRNPLVRTATARLLLCICVDAGMEALIGTTANTRTRKTYLSMLAKTLTDKNQETKKFGERLYRMLRKHKFFEEYFYKDMDTNLRTNLKRILKGL